MFLFMLQGIFNWLADCNKMEFYIKQLLQILNLVLKLDKWVMVMSNAELCFKNTAKKKMYSFSFTKD